MRPDLVTQFLQATDRFAKTIMFCENVEHAERMRQAMVNEKKKRVARRYIESESPRLHMLCQLINSGDTSPLDEYDVLAGPVPSTA